LHYCDAGFSRDETVYKGLDLSKEKIDDVTCSTTQETLTSSTAVASHRNYDDDADKSSKLRRFCLSRGDRLSFTAGSCRRLANCSRSACAGHVVSLRPGDDNSSDVRVSLPHDRVSSSLASCRSLPTGFPLRLKPYPPSLIQTAAVLPSSMRGPPTTAAAAFHRRTFFEALRSPPMHGYVNTPACDRDSAVCDPVAVPNANYAAAAAAAAVLGTQLAIHAWFRSALDSSTSPLRLTADVSCMTQGCQDWIPRSPTSPLPLTQRRFERSSPSACQPVDDVDEVASQLDETSRPESALCHVEQTVSDLDDDQLQQSPSSDQT